MKTSDFYQAVSVNGKTYTIVDIPALEKKGLADIGRLPFSIRILVEKPVAQTGRPGGHRGRCQKDCRLAESL